jgi:peptidoglycan LD-endopeptidase CwlK
MVVSVIAFFCATFILLGWVGWRYFVAPMASRIAVVQAGSAPLDVESASSNTGRATNENRPRSRALAASAHRSLLLALSFVVFSVAGVLAFSGRISLDPLSAPDLDRQQHIQIALRPEALVPPPPLPPSTFIGTDRPGLETADRDWGRLDPKFTSVVLKVFARLEARGYPFTLLEGYRSPERQDALADAGAHVTNARAFQSKHQYGLALDAAPLRNGRLVISEKDTWAMDAYTALGEEAEKAGLVWGGRWRLKDYGHIETSGPISGYAKRN